MKKEVFDKIVKKSQIKHPPYISLYTQENNGEIRFWGLSYEKKKCDRDKLDDLNLFLKLQDGRPLEGVFVVQDNEVNKENLGTIAAIVNTLSETLPNYCLPEFKDVIVMNSKCEYFSMAENNYRINSERLNGRFQFNRGDFAIELEQLWHRVSSYENSNFEFKEVEKIEPEKTNKKMKM